MATSGKCAEALAVATPRNWLQLLLDPPLIRQRRALGVVGKRLGPFVPPTAAQNQAPGGVASCALRGCGSGDARVRVLAASSGASPALCAPRAPLGPQSPIAYY
jgi:hypothetical protein